MLNNLRFLNQEFAPGDTFEDSIRFYDYEQYFVLMDEFKMTLAMSVISVLSVILVISSSFNITILVAICVFMTDLFLTGLIYFWGLTFNPIVMI